MLSWNLSERVENNTMFLFQDKLESQPSFRVFISSITIAMYGNIESIVFPFLSFFPASVEIFL